MVQKGLNSTPKAIKNLQTTSATTVVTTAATVQTVAPSTNQPLQNVKILQIPQQKVIQILLILSFYLWIIAVKVWHLLVNLWLTNRREVRCELVVIYVGTNNLC